LERAYVKRVRTFGMPKGIVRRNSNRVWPTMQHPVGITAAAAEGSTAGTVTACDLDDPIHETQILTECHRFWVYPDDWFSADKLQTIRFGFEPLDSRFYAPENRPLEVGLMPLPLYDYNFNLVNPMIPYLKPTISISTRFCEQLVVDEPCRIGLRQGAYRSNPYVVAYDLDTSMFMRGTYQYNIKLNLPDGSSRVSRKFTFTVS
jgi:hypothetical protein